MNKERRKLLRQAHNNLDTAMLLTQRALDEEQDSYYNLPESIQDSERGEAMDVCMDLLADAIDDMASAAAMLESAIG